MLKERHEVTLYEASDELGGLARDFDGVQGCGPHAFHTDNERVWRFVQPFAAWMPYDLRVVAMTEGGAFTELPRRAHDDPVFRIYSEKAWGCEWSRLPADVRERVPQLCADDRVGYHAGRFKAQPAGGYTALCESMAAGVKIERGAVIHHPNLLPDADAVIWACDINSYDACYGARRLPWIGRHWHYVQDGVLRATAPVVNYCTHAVPQIRSYASVNPWHDARGVVSEFYAQGGVPCYPVTDRENAARAAAIVNAAKFRGHWLVGRMAQYRYLDMDKTIESVMDAIQEAGL